MDVERLVVIVSVMVGEAVHVAVVVGDAVAVLDSELVLVVVCDAD